MPRCCPGIRNIMDMFWKPVSYYSSLLGSWRSSRQQSQNIHCRWLVFKQLVISNLALIFHFPSILGAWAKRFPTVYRPFAMASQWECSLIVSYIHPSLRCSARVGTFYRYSMQKGDSTATYFCIPPSTGASSTRTHSQSYEYRAVGSLAIWEAALQSRSECCSRMSFCNVRVSSVTWFILGVSDPRYFRLEEFTTPAISAQGLQIQKKS